MVGSIQSKSISSYILISSLPSLNLGIITLVTCVFLSPALHLLLLGKIEAEARKAMESTRKSSNKIRDIVRLQQMLKKWKKTAANAPNNSSSRSNAGNPYGASTTTSNNGTASKGIRFLKRTLSFNDVSSDAVPKKGFLAVCVGSELKRFVIPTAYLRHHAFEMLLQEAEEEFGFQQEGVLKIPCEVSVFENILKAVEDKQEVVFFLNNDDDDDDDSKTSSDKMMKDAASVGYCSSTDSELPHTQHPQMCR